MSLTRAALALTLSLCVVAWPAASDDDPVPAVWPLAAAWSNNFPVADAISLVMGPSRLFVVEPAEVSAWNDGTLLWKSGLRANARPVTDEGRVFVSSGDTIHALSDANGTEQWRVVVGKIPVSPAARSGWLIVPGEDGSLQGINASQGREIWRIALPAPLTAPVDIDGDLVFGACADGLIRAWQIADGAVRWTRELGTRPLQLLATKGEVFVGGEDGRLRALRQRDGRIDWTYDLAMPIAGALAADDRHIYAATIDNSVHAHSFNGHQAWHQLLAARVVDGMFSDSGRVYVPQSNGEIRIFLAKDGKRAGRLNASPAEATVIGGLVAAGAGDQLQIALTVSAGSQLTVTTYRRTGIGAPPATSAPPATPLLLSLRGGRP
ncbi:MAG TPA: PQQ-binding-like beta-propeller repeat protein [Vicinamibacterales bacterium]|nr:PQQ-binding-like beta-propeller repeat protein [Vicinamibacterales bacterium]